MQYIHNMKSLIYIALITAVLLAVTRSEALTLDKQLHYGASAGINAGVYLVTGDAQTAFLASLIAGIAKEATDDHFDNEDMFYNMLGNFTATVVILSFE